MNSSVDLSSVEQHCVQQPFYGQMLHTFIRVVGLSLLISLIVAQQASARNKPTIRLLPTTLVEDLRRTSSVAKEMILIDATYNQRTFGIAQNAFVVGCVANWRPRKGIEVLVRACGELPQARSGNEFTAWDFETMAYGIAPVVTDSGGSPELVVDGESGLVVRSGDAHDLVAALLRLYNDTVLRAIIGRNAQHRIADHFRIETTITETAALYRELLGDRGDDNVA